VGYLNPIPNFWVLDTSVIQTLRRAHNVKIPLSKSSWWKLLLEAAKLNCRDSIDYVYGLQALLPEADQIRVDYSIGSGDLFWKVFVGFTVYPADADTKAAIIQFGRKMNVTGREVVCKKGTGSLGRARFRSMFGRDPEEIFQTQSHQDELIDIAGPDRIIPSIDIGNPEIMEFLGLVDGEVAGPELSMEDQPLFISSRTLSIDLNWWRTWYAGTTGLQTQMFPWIKTSSKLSTSTTNNPTIVFHSASKAPTPHTSHLKTLFSWIRAHSR
jgi:hypothetical protein